MDLAIPILGVVVVLVPIFVVAYLGGALVAWLDTDGPEFDEE